MMLREIRIWRQTSNGLAITLAVALPWSTSATIILIPLWVISTLPLVKVSDFIVELKEARSLFPMLFGLLGLVGMAWSIGSVHDRIDGFSSFWRFFLIPLLIVYYVRAGNPNQAIYAFFGSCTALLAFSFLTYYVPELLWWRPGFGGVPAKNYITQSMEFGVCGTCVAAYGIARWRAGHAARGALWLLLAGLFFANIVFIATARAELIAIATMLLVLSFREFGWKGVPVCIVLLLSGLCVAWFGSDYLRSRIDHARWEYQAYLVSNRGTSVGARLESWQKSKAFVAAAPLFGHGTGSIGSLFTATAEPARWLSDDHAVGSQRASSLVTRNPHNQTLAVVIQVGLVGVFIMYCMWAAHLVVFLEAGLIGSFGLSAMVQTIVGCLFNTHLFDFTEGWFYVLAVGVLMGAVAKSREPERVVARAEEL